MLVVNSGVAQNFRLAKVSGSLGNIEITGTSAGDEMTG
jgi:hypothetical protein